MVVVVCVCFRQREWDVCTRNEPRTFMPREASPLNYISTSFGSRLQAKIFVSGNKVSLANLSGKCKTTTVQKQGWAFSAVCHNRIVYELYLGELLVFEVQKLPLFSTTTVSSLEGLFYLECELLLRWQELHFLLAPSSVQWQKNRRWNLLLRSAVFFCKIEHLFRPLRLDHTCLLTEIWTVLECYLQALTSVCLLSGSQSRNVTWYTGKDPVILCIPL